MPNRAEYTDVVSYSQAHLRLKNDRGRPDGHTCLSCGQQANEWAYMGGCPNELVEHGKRYSTDQSRYEPLCFVCHRRQDRALADGRSIDVCPQGHLWDAENTGYRRNRSPQSGIRYCRACQRENTRRWRAQRISIRAA